MNHHEDNTLRIFSIGPDNIIKGSVDIGPGEEKESLSKLKASLKDVPTTETVIIYCGCCPFAQCPNIRPAFQLLKDLRSEEHTSELQSRGHLVCRLLLEKKKTKFQHVRFH